MSKGTPIQIDEDELPSTLAGIERGLPVKVKQGIFNPSFYVSIIEDKEREKAVLEENYRIKETNDSMRKIGKLDSLMEERQPVAISDIFNNVKLLS